MICFPGSPSTTVTRSSGKNSYKYVKMVSVAGATLTRKAREEYCLAKPCIEVNLDARTGSYAGTLVTRSSAILEITYPVKRDGTGTLVLQDGMDPPEDLETFTLDTDIIDSV